MLAGAVAAVCLPFRAKAAAPAAKRFKPLRLKQPVFVRINHASGVGGAFRGWYNGRIIETEEAVAVVNVAEAANPSAAPLACGPGSPVYAFGTIAGRRFHQRVVVVAPCPVEHAEPLIG